MRNAKRIAERIAADNCKDCGGGLQGKGTPDGFCDSCDSDRQYGVGDQRCSKCGGPWRQNRCMGKCEAGPTASSAGFTVGEFETPYFSFRAFGTDADDCDRLLGEAWKRHADATGADPDYYSRDGVNFYDATVGSVFRDTDPI